MEFISERVSVVRKPTSLSLVITTRLEGFQRALLLAWVTMWTFCGVYFIYELGRTSDPDMRRMLWVMVAFWVYYEFQVLRTLAWRLFGFEKWLLKEGVLTIKNSLWNFGKAHDYFVENIEDFGLLKIDPLSWKWQVANSFWSRGAEHIGFTYMGRKLAAGRGLTSQEAERVVQFMEPTLRRAARKA